MLRRFLLAAAILTAALLSIPACGNDRPDKGATTPVKEPGPQPGVGRAG
jgi:hypothetical protein